MSRNADIGSINSARFHLAAGAIAKIGPFSGQLACNIKLISGGTLEIGGYSLASMLEQNPKGFTSLVGGAVATMISGQTFGMLYPLSANEIFSVNSAGEYFLYASAATCVVAISFGKSQGAP